MAFEYLDLENKMYVPTQQLISQIQLDLISLYASVRQHLIDAHSTLAVLCKEFYDNPVATMALWYNQSANYCTELYAGITEQLIPQVQSDYEKLLAQVQTDYEKILASASEFALQTRDNISYMTENPEQVTAEAIEAMNETLTAAGNVSTELLDELQTKTSEIITLLLEQPLQTMEAAYMQVLTSLLNSYFELVSGILAGLHV